MKNHKFSFFFCALSCATAYSIAVHADTMLASNTANASKSTMQSSNASSSNQTVQDVQPMNSATPPAMINLKYCAEPFITADYLFWTVRQENMDYAFPVQFDAQLNTISKNRIQNLDFEFGSGFRVGAGLDFKHDGWDTYVNYTRFYPERMHDSLTADDGEILFPTWHASNFAEFASGTFDFASQHWHFENDVIDWELGRNFFISRYLTLRPFAGLKTAWQEQNQRLVYIDDVNHRRFTTKNHVHFWGIGIRCGLNSAWYVYKKNLSIVADFALTGLWSRVKTSQNQDINFTTSEINPFHPRESFHTIRPVIEWMLGAQWESWLYDNGMKISLRAGWEEQVWFNQNDLLEIFTNTVVGGIYSTKARGGNLSLEGLTIRGRFDF